MRVLLDTHALIWFIEGNDRLSPAAKIKIEDISNERFISSVSLWEIVIKSSRNKLELKKSFEEINKIIYDNDIQIIAIEIKHLKTLLTLEYHHADPFDRLIIAQAISDDMTILSVDKNFEAYQVNVIW